MTRSFTKRAPRRGGRPTQVTRLAFAFALGASAAGWTGDRAGAFDRLAGDADFRPQRTAQWFAASPIGAAELRAFHEHAGRALGSVFGHSGCMINLAASIGDA